MFIKTTLAFSLLFFFSAVSCHDVRAQKLGNDEKVVMKEAELEGTERAPDFPTGLEWLNTNRPFSISDFKGRFVLLDFWTFCCINCMHIIPDLKKLEAKYPKELVVIGVHSAKFTNEKQSESIRQAILRYEIRHPVINDNGFQVWNAYGVNSWPTLVLINPNGKVIGTHSGEGIYDLFDQVISQAVTYFDKKGELMRSSLDLALEAAKKEKTVLSFPGKIAADATGTKLFITDSNHNRILVTSPDGTMQAVIGSGRSGKKDGAFSEAEFNHPQGLCLDGETLYIADTENHLIRAANLTSKTVTTLIGTGAQARDNNVPGKGTSVALNSPWDLLVHDGKLYIAMAGAHQIWVADLKTQEAKPFAGSGREARIDGKFLEAALAQPSGITTDGKKLYFVDSESSSLRSADFDPNGEVETIIGKDLFEYGDIDGNTEVARLQHPLGITYKDGLIYITDTYNSKIKIIDPVRKTSTSYAGTGTHGLSDGALRTAQFNEPSGLAFIGDKLYIADCNNHQIRVVDTKTKIVSTLQLKNLQLLAQKMMDNFTGRDVVMPPQVLRAGPAKISVAINIPRGYHINEQAPFYLDWKSWDEKAIRFTSTPDQVMPNSLIETQVPVDAIKGTADVTFESVIYFCKEGSSVCLFDNVRVTIPIEVKETGASMFGVAINARALPVM